MRAQITWVTLLWITILVFNACSTNHDTSHQLPFQTKSPAWVARQLDQMTLEEKIGQLLVWKKDFHKEDFHATEIQSIYSSHQPSGFLFEGISASDFVAFAEWSKYQTSAPPLIATAETSLLQNQFQQASFPSTLAIQAAADDSLQARIQQAFQQQLTLMQMNYIAPTNSYIPQNASQTIGLLQTEQLLHTYPFRENIEREAKSLRLGRAILEIDTIENMPNSFVAKQLFDDFQYQGLLEASVQNERDVYTALKAGADLLIIETDLAFAERRIKRMLRYGQLSEAELDWKVGRILAMKSWLQPEWTHDGQARSRTVSNHPEALSGNWGKDLTDYFDHPDWDPLKRKLFKESAVLLNNPENRLPFGRLYKKGLRILQIGPESSKVLEEYVKKYVDTKSYHLDIKPNEAIPDVSRYLPKGWSYLVVLNNVNVATDRDKAFLRSINKVAEETEITVVNFGNPLNLAAMSSKVALLQLFDWNNQSCSIAPQILFGGIAAKGKLPVAINDRYHEGFGLETTANRLEYGLPEEVGIASRKLVGIDAIAKTAIDGGATPGCQVLVAKNGKVIYSKGFGHHSYRKNESVETDDLYDIASVTKVAATTLASMKLFEEKKFRLDDRLRSHLDLPGRSSIRNISIRRLLTHQSGLKSHMPVIPYLQYRDKPNAGCDLYFCKNQSDSFSIQIADQFYFKNNYQDKIWDDLNKERLYRMGRYKYSDANFILLQKLAEEKAKLSLDSFVYRNFYYPLGLRHLTYRPLDHFEKKDIVPTQLDNRWRQQLVHGYVHDETAGLFGGVAGNAGLFSNAEDLAVVFQMLLNGGTYGGRKYLEKETIDLFTRSHSYVKRGLGFDKPKKKAYTAIAESASDQTFGHTGFTGTCVWADPQHDLVFVFLSNRLHPNVRNKKLFRDRVRERIHQVIYDALGTYEIKIPETPKPDQARS
ncbi:MAG: serine hydrolase [Saprospiraceae bacterium]|nr:serine hydrolase [Saprospiraceae bacterium]